MGIPMTVLLSTVIAMILPFCHCNRGPEKGFSQFQFTHHLYNATINENSIPKTYIDCNVKMGIYIKDPLWTIKYKIFSGDESNLFKTEEYTVGDFSFLRIKTRSSNTAMLNREVRDIYTLTIQGTEKTYDYEARTKVIIRVLDANDLKPLFYPASYSVTVSEDTPLKASLVRVSATDADLGSNSEFYFSFPEKLQAFMVHPSTGTIILSKYLNYTLSPKYEFHVLAEDRMKKISGTKGFGNVARVTINVEKIDSKPPIIASIDVTSAKNEMEFLNAIMTVFVAGPEQKVQSVDIIAGNQFADFKVIPSDFKNQEYKLISIRSINWLNYPNGLNLSFQAKDNSRPPLLSPIKSLYIAVQKDNNIKFEKEVYHVMLSEFSPPKSFVVLTKVISDHSNISYAISKNHDSANFLIHSKSGLITTAVQMDFEKKSHFEFDVTTTNKEAKTRVIIDIVDENDNAPKFSQTSYQETVFENVAIGTKVLQVTALDSDSGSKGFVTYAIANRGPLPFSIDPFTGVVSTSEELDYELMQRLYHLRIWASDSGTPFSHVTESTATIIMNNVNDNIPKFERIKCQATIPANFQQGTCIGIMSAVDWDELQQVRYEIVSGNEQGLFDLNPTSGMLMLQKQIPQNKPDDVIRSYSLKITATDGENYALPTDINITVSETTEEEACEKMKCEETQVLKNLTNMLIQSIKPKIQSADDETFSDVYIVNYHPPKFDKNLPSSIDIKENTPINSTVLHIVAHDEDTGFNGKLVYVISDGNEDGCFLINMETGELKVFSHLDRETKGFYILNITVYDLGTPQKASWKFLAINIIDVNDNEPKFEQPAYFLSVSEDTELRRIIFKVTATDTDLEDNGRVKYSFLTPTETFTINEFTGEIGIIQPLDREQYPYYRLKIEARDQAKLEPQLMSTADILVAVEDVNDNPPRFLSAPYKVQVPEDFPVGTMILWVEGYDLDLGLGGQINYNLMNSENGVFHLDTSTGVLTLERELDFEKRSQYNLTVRAVDHGKPRALSSSCIVEVEVIDINENLNAPRFTSFVFKGSVEEGSPIGTTVTTLTALDEDSGKDGEVRYFISDGTGFGVFTIDQETGTIQTVESLDRESISRYWLTVYATDMGTVPLTSWTEVYIEVLDINDNPPVPTKPVYFGSILENSPKDLSVVRIEASDPDSTSEGKLVFKITDTQLSYFNINPKTGVISTTASLLDREQKAEHIFEVIVSDGGKPLLQATATVIIEVLDVNDEVPKFTHKLFTVRLPERQGITQPMQVYRMIANDRDEGVNSEVTYSLVKDSNEKDFTIDPSSGIITSKSDFIPGDYSILSIKATDNGSPPKSSSVRLHIDWIQKPAPSTEPLVFDEPHFNFAVMETDPVTHMVGIISTEITQSELWFDITDGDSLQEFDIEKNSGSIVIAKRLDARQRSNYNLTVSVTDGTKSIITQAYIHVVDINEHRPQFLKNQYEVSVPEDTSPWKDILQLSSRDEDGSTKLIYTIHSSVNAASLKLFQLDPSSGSLFLIEELDYEAQLVHILTVMVRDQDIPVKRNFVRVIVNVEDCNDHAPVFSNALYDGSVFNLAPAGTEVLQVKALDKDKGTNAQIIYSFHSGNTDNIFNIDPDSGQITVAKPIKELSQEHYHLTVKATDQGFPPLSDLTTVNIHIKLSELTPPYFSQKEYFTEVSEAADVGQPLITVSATSPSTVNYEIKAGDPNGTFHLNSYSGVLSLQKPLDFETIISYQLQVRVTNLARAYSDAVIYVYVIDENDNAPVFLKSNFTGQVRESLHPNSMVMGDNNTPLVIQAVDADKDLNAHLIYQILEPDAQKYFKIEPGIGTLSTTNSIDYELTQVFHFTVQVRDSGNPSLYAENPARVTIQVLNINDCPPKFEQAQYETVLFLPAFSGMEVIKVLAEDKDSNVTYTIQDGNVNTDFSIQPTSGLILVHNAASLKQSYELTIRASDGLYKDVTHVKINFTEITESGLTFEHSSYKGSVMENTTDIKTVAAVRSSGNYLNEPLTYTLLHSGRMFSITPTSGIIQTTGLIFDREQQFMYDLVVEVRDTRKPPRIAHTSVKVSVEDINDNTPEFLNLPYYTNVQEDAEAGDVIFQVTAIDKDLGDNGKIMYSLAEDFVFFRIDPYLGDVSLKQSFDFYTLNKYVLRVIATDCGDPPLLSEAELLVTVQNKSNPVFQSHHYTIDVPENIPPHTIILHVQARNPEGYRLVYNLVSENASKIFNLDFKTGALSVVDTLDYETETSHVLIVRATDAVLGTYSEATVLVEVEDVNDNPPFFQQKVYVAQIAEGLPIGSPVIQMHASDKDSGRNKDITYEIMESDGSSMFSIDAVTGQIVTTQELDYETTQQLNLKVRAVDNGMPSLNGEALLLVNLSDVNDNCPKFSQPQYNSILNEMAVCGQIVIRVQASDPDVNDVNNLKYFIVSGNNHRYFYINQTSGLISFNNACKKNLDHFYNLTVSVTDGVFQDIVPVNIDMITANKHTPYFDQSVYEVELVENAQVGTQVIKLAAIDPDDGPFGSVDYTIINMLANEKFSINRNGEITTTEKLDRENPTQRVIAIKVMAKDGGGKVAFCTVKIILTDENDNAPLFKASQYQVSIKSNLSKGSPVIQIMAYDADEGSNADVTYSVDETGDITEDIIEINPFSGVVSIKESLASLENRIFNFTVKAEDNGLPRHNSSVPVQINVIPPEVSLPRFSEPLYTFTAVEDIPVGSEVGTVKANAEEPVIYSLVEGNTVESNKDRVFSLDKESGTLVLQKTIDHEKTKWYQIDVMALCHSNSTEVFTLASVNIQVDDINDNYPEFDTNLYKAVLMENMPAGTTVMQVTANDPDTDSNGQVTYRLEPESDDVNELFAIDSKNGWITSLKELDCEAKDLYQFLVIATDQGGKVKLSSSAAVEIIVMDENDNPPQFTSDVYKGSVIENSPPGEPIVSVDTKDFDVSEENRQLTCYITDGDPQGIFSIEQVDGKWTVVVKGLVDREEKEKHIIKITATDGRFQTSSEVEIHVLDINDNSPQCEQVLYTESVPEDAPVGFFILKVSARDPDLGTSGQITYTLHGPRADKFRLDPQTGDLHTLEILDRELEMEYELFVKSTDGGGRSCQADIMLVIQDINDNAPKFSSNHYEISVFDNTTVKTPIAVLFAKDPDAGINSEVMYSLVDSANNFFSVDESTGILRLEKTLSDATTSVFELKIQATDRGLPHHLSSVAKITVNVVSLSDYVPVFQHSEYFTSVLEGSAIGTEVLRVSAQINDATPNVIIFYNIISGNEEGKFTLDSNTGVIYVNGTLDFEQAHEYYLLLEGAREGSSFLNDTTMVVINITDINDNHPRFNREEYHAEISEDISLGEIILKVSAEDLDGPMNNQILYNIVNGDPQQQFSIDRDTGDIWVRHHLDREEHSSYTLMIRASDNGNPPLFSDVQAVIKVSDVNDNPPIFFQLNYSLVIQEECPIGSSILQLFVIDRDTPKNGPPFSFRIIGGHDGKSFQISQNGLLSTAAVLRKKIKEDYLLEIQATDSGYPPLSSSCFVKIKIIEESLYPPSVVPLEIFITTIDKVFTGKVIGKIHATDQDLHDVLTYSLASESPVNGHFTVDSVDGKIITNDILEPGLYSLNVTVSDGKFTSFASVDVCVWRATQDVLDNGVTVSVTGISPGEFIGYHWKSIQKILGDIPGVTKQAVHIAGLQQDSTASGLEALLVLKEKNSSLDIMKVLNKNFEEKDGFKALQVRRGLCRGGNCPPSCKFTVQMDSSRISTHTTARTSFITPHHFWETVCSCNESAAEFKENSYLRYNYINDNTDFFNLSLRLRTNQSNGLIMVTNGTDSGALRISNKDLMFDYKCGYSPVRTLHVLNASVSDGIWHHVSLQLKGFELQMTLDNMSSASVTLLERCQIHNKEGFLIFGGNSTGVINQGFRGCLDLLTFNGEIMKKDMDRNRKITGIFECCSCMKNCNITPCLKERKCTTGLQCVCYPPYPATSHCETKNQTCNSQPCSEGTECETEAEGYRACPDEECDPLNWPCVCEVTIDKHFGLPEIMVTSAVLIGVIILVIIFIFSRKRYLHWKKHIPVNTTNSNGFLQPDSGRNIIGDSPELPAIEMEIMTDAQNNLAHDPFLPNEMHRHSDFFPSNGVRFQKQRGTVVCSVAPNLPPAPPSSSDNESVLKNNWELEYDDSDYYSPHGMRDYPQYEFVEERYPSLRPASVHRSVHFEGFPFPLEHYNRRAPLPPCYSNQTLDDFLGRDTIPLPPSHCPNEYTAISYYPTEHTEGVNNLNGTGYRRLSMRLSVAQPSYADCVPNPQTVASSRTPRNYEGSDMIESDYGSCEEVMF
uniref:FAT atypical cadherin 2 n=1 Tax=Erpetoichthys calabaricus TaxID=27687 RepID=A0A8C4T505_ERPCA